MRLTPFPLIRAECGVGDAIGHQPPEIDRIAGIVILPGDVVGRARRPLKYCWCAQIVGYQNRIDIWWVTAIIDAISITPYQGCQAETTFGAVAL